MVNGIAPANLFKIPTEKIRIFGVGIDNLSLNALLKIIEKSIKSDQKCILNYVNIHALNLAHSTPWFRSFLNHSDIVFCDGFGAILGAWLTGQKLEHRFTPPDWIDQLCELSSMEGFSLYLLGAQPGVAEKAANSLREKHPGCNIIGTYHGYFEKNIGSPENEKVIKEINSLRPNILIVGFGMPMQEKWIQENFGRLDVNVFLPVGAALDYISGEVRRAPRWMTDHGLEWLGRLIIEPRRLWKRYLIGIPVFFWCVLLQRLGLLRFDEDSSPRTE